MTAKCSAIIAAMLRRVSFLACLFALHAPALSSAQPKSWTWEEAEDEVEDRAGRRIRFSPRLHFWIANFDRPPRACRTVALGPPRINFLREQQFPGGGFACNSEDSDELAFGSGFEFAFRIVGPLYMTAGVDFVYTSPQFSAIKNQLIVGLPFGILFTWYEWFLRPIAFARATPVLYVTDDSRDYTLGGGGGVAYRILRFGSISFTAGYHWAETMTSIELQLGVHPLF